MRLNLLVIFLLLHPAALAASFELPAASIDVVGTLHQIDAADSDTFVALGRAHGVGYDEMLAANPGIDPWLPGEGSKIVLPSLFVLPDAEREGIVINLAEKRLYYFPPGTDEQTAVMTYPIGIGRLEAGTPTGRTTVVDKLRDPVWYPPQSIIDEHAARGDTLPRIVPPGPDNPLGSLALQLGLPGYLIHGTNQPAGIGMRVSHGCIRLLPDDIAVLAERVPRGTPVRIVDQPYKMGWVGKTLFLEVHRAFEENAERDDDGMSSIVEMYVRATVDREVDVDWDTVRSTFEQARGIPVAINGVRAVAQRERFTPWCGAAAPQAACAAP